MVFVSCKETKTRFTTESVDVVAVKREFSEQYNIPENAFYLVENGRICSGATLDPNANIQVHFRLCGGKGGFGSMLRAIGAQIEKTTNREACRDLSGRRLRDINEEKRLKNWIEKKRNEEKEDPDEKFQKKIGKLLSVPKKEFKDANYEEARSNLLENVSDSVEQGFKKAKEVEAAALSLKRKSETTKKQPAKKIKGAVFLDEGLSSDSSDDDSDSEVGESSSGAGSSSSKN